MEEKEKLEEYIENIEQLGADSRFYNNALSINNDYEKYGEILKTKLESIIYWSGKAIKEVNKKTKEK